MEGSKFIHEAAVNGFYALACQMVSEDIEDFKECLKLNTMSGRTKDEYETFKCYADFKYAVKERCEIELGCEDGIELLRMARDILIQLCESREISKIKEIVPHWFSTEERWGWKKIYETEAL